MVVEVAVVVTPTIIAINREVNEPEKHERGVRNHLTKPTYVTVTRYHNV